MKTNVHYIKKDFKISKSQDSVTCVITSRLSLSHNPILKAVVKDDVSQITNMLKSKNAHQENGDIIFTVYGYSSLKNGDDFNLSEGKRIAEDKAQAKSMQKAYHIYYELLKIMTNCCKYVCFDRCVALKTTTVKMIKHVNSITSY